MDQHHELSGLSRGPGVAQVHCQGGHDGYPDAPGVEGEAPAIEVSVERLEITGFVGLG